METGISKPIVFNQRRPKPAKQNKPWFDPECHTKRKQYIKIKNRLRKSKSFQDISVLKTEAKAYKRFINRKRHIYNKNLHKKIRNLKSTKPKEYWNLLNPKTRNTNNDIGLQPLYEHFKQIIDIPNQENYNLDPSNISVEGDEALNEDFTPTEINNLINKLKNKIMWN